MDDGNGLQDTDNSDQNQTDSDSSSLSSDSDEDLKDEIEKRKFEPIKAILSDRGDIYYVTNYDG